MGVTKESLLSTMPVTAGEFVLREWRREDLDELARWPGYPPPYETFNLRFISMAPRERDALFEERRQEPGRVVVVTDHRCEPAVGYFALIDIDWETGAVGNMAIRVKPDWCDRGAGTLLLRAIGERCFSAG